MEATRASPMRCARGLSQEHAVAEISRRGLLRATAFLRARLAQQLSLKKLPQLGFTFVGIAREGAAP
jgi:ribosome-binding factor A